MRTGARLVRIGCVLLIVAIAAAAADGLSAAERTRIEALIAAVAGMTDVAFIRNGRSYDAGTAAEFLRRKWQRHAAEVRSAEDFIDKIASTSSTTGEPYRIRFADGRERPCADALREELEQIRTKVR